ncbi:MAG: hypothetical protein PUD22_00275 [Erysipelotrichaceae bacterium]|nr:hypothetical protein [Erysipelotrichaceae bacterium]
MSIRSILDAFAEAYKYAEFDFYKIKTEVINLLKVANEKGYSTPMYCEVAIDVINKHRTDVLIQLIYNKEGKYIRFKKNLDLGMIVNIPIVVKNRLDQESKVTFKIEDIQGLYVIAESDIKTSIEYKSLETFKFTNIKEEPIQKILTIKDDLFYYTVECVCAFDDGRKETRKKYYAEIRNLPIEVINKILASDDYQCSLDVTHANK